MPGIYNCNDATASRARSDRVSAQRHCSADRRDVCVSPTKLKVGFVFRSNEQIVLRVQRDKVVQFPRRAYEG